MKNRFQVFPHGMMLGPMPFKPVMIFKTHDQTEVMPVVIEPLHAGLMVTEQENIIQDHAYKATLQIFERLDVKIRSVYFNFIEGHELFCLVSVMQGERLMQLKFKAKDIMSLAIKAGAQFYANEEVLEKSKLINLEWAMQQAPQHEQGDKTLMPGPDWMH